MFSRQSEGVDLDYCEHREDEDIITRIARTEALAQDLGIAVAEDEAAFAELLPEVVSSDGRLWSFGQGLAAGTSHPAETWNRLVTAFTATMQSYGRPEVLRGFLHRTRQSNPALTTVLLDEAAEHESLARFYPYLQVAVFLERPDVARLRLSVVLGRAPAAVYRHLASGRATDPIPAPDLKELVLAIAALPSGEAVAIEILQMRLFSDKDRARVIAPELLDAGRQLIRQITFTGNNDPEDHRLGAISADCLRGEEGVGVVKEICQRLKSAVAQHETNAFYHDDLLVGIFTAQPVAALDGLCGGDQRALHPGVNILRDVGRLKHPLSVVSDENLLAWCDQCRCRCGSTSVLPLKKSTVFEPIGRRQ